MFAKLLAQEERTAVTVSRSGYGDVVGVIFSGGSCNDTMQLCSDLQHLASSLLVTENAKMIAHSREVNKNICIITDSLTLAGTIVRMSLLWLLCKIVITWTTVHNRLFKYDFGKNMYGLMHVATLKHTRGVIIFS